MCGRYKLIFCALLALFCQLGSAADGNCLKTLTVSAPKAWPPYSYEEKGEIKGLDIEILQSLLAKNDLCPRYVNYPSPGRAFAELQKENVDLIFAASMSLERAAIAEVSVPYRQEVISLFATPETITLLPDDIPRDTKNYEFLKKWVIAINRGSVFGEGFDAFLKGNSQRIIETVLPYKRINLLQRNRVDFMVEDQLTGLYLIHSRGLENTIIESDVVINDNKVHFMLRKGVFSDVELAAFNQSIHDSYQDNQALVQQYLKRYK